MATFTITATDPNTGKPIALKIPAASEAEAIAKAHAQGWKTQHMESATAANSASSIPDDTLRAALLAFLARPRPRPILHTALGVFFGLFFWSLFVGILYALFGV